MPLLCGFRFFLGMNLDFSMCTEFLISIPHRSV